MKKIISITLLSLLLSLVSVVPIAATEIKKDTEVNTIDENGIEYIYDENGDVIEALIPITFQPGMTRSTTWGMWKIVSGVCMAVEVLSGHSCLSIVRHVGIEFINGVYMWKNQKYTGTVNADYKYIPGKIPGCMPVNSGQCNTGRWVLSVRKS